MPALRKVISAVGVVLAVFGASTAWAETLTIRSVYPAGSDRAAEVHVMAIDTFGGEEGPSAAIALGDALRSVSIRGNTWFSVVPSAANGRADAVLQGVVEGETDRRRSEPTERKVCVERNEKRKCVREEKRKVPCWTVASRLVPRLRLVSASGEQLSALDPVLEREERYCGDDERPDVRAMRSGLIDELAGMVRAELAPMERLDKIRVLETRKGMAKPDSSAFRDAVRLTKRDEEGACAAFARLQGSNPHHGSVLHNLALCAERRGDYGAARSFYERAATSGIGEPQASEGMARLEAYDRAAWQLDVHG